MPESDVTLVDGENGRSLFHDTIVQLESESIAHQVPLKVIFQAATRGEIELLFHRPEVSPRTVLRPLGRDLIVGEPNILQTPDYLVMTQEPCLQLLDRPSALVTQSHSGYRSRSAGSFLTQMHASEAGRSKKSPVQVDGKDFLTPETKFGFWGSWALWSDGGPVRYAVRPEDVYVRQGEFDRWRLHHFRARAENGLAHDQNGQIWKENSELHSDVRNDRQFPGIASMSSNDDAAAVRPLVKSNSSPPKKRRNESELGEIHYYAEQHGNSAAAQKFSVSVRQIRNLRRQFKDSQEQKRRDEQEQKPAAELHHVWPQNPRQRN